MSTIYSNINANIILNQKELDMLDLYSKWSKRCQNDSDAVRNTLKEYEDMREQMSRERYWDKVASSEVERAQNMGMDDQPTSTYSKEDLTDVEISLMEYYVKYTKWLDGHPLAHKWEELKTARHEAWSLFLEEVETNWMQVYKYEDKLNKRLAMMDKEGLAPKPESWEKAMAHLSKLKDQVVRFYTGNDGVERVDYRGFQGDTWTSRRNHITFPLYQKAQAATKAAALFWDTKEGKDLSSYKEKRTQIWNLICEQGLQTRFAELNRITNEELNLNFTWGEVSEDCDNPLLNNRDKMSDLPADFWYQLAGLPATDHYDVCQYETVDKSSVSREELQDYYNNQREQVEMVEAEIDQLILEESWTSEEEEYYQQSLQGSEELYF